MAGPATGTPTSDTDPHTHTYAPTLAPLLNLGGKDHDLTHRGICLQPVQNSQ